MAKEARTGHIVYVHTQNLYLGFHEAERACALQAFRYTSMPSRRAM